MSADEMESEVVMNEVAFYPCLCAKHAEQGTHVGIKSRDHRVQVGPIASEDEKGHALERRRRQEWRWVRVVCVRMSPAFQK
jgi:hypothetical protein